MEGNQENFLMETVDVELHLFFFAFGLGHGKEREPQSTLFFSSRSFYYSRKLTSEEIEVEEKR